MGEDGALGSHGHVQVLPSWHLHRGPKTTMEEIGRVRRKGKMSLENML